MLAAHRAEIPAIIIPKDNEKDIPEIPESIKKAIEFHPVKNMDEVIKHAFAKKFKIFTAKKKPTKTKKKSKTRSSIRQPSISTYN